MVRCCEIQLTALEQAMGNRKAPEFNYCPWCGDRLTVPTALEEMLAGAPEPDDQVMAAKVFGAMFSELFKLEPKVRAFRDAVEQGTGEAEAREELFRWIRAAEQTRHQLAEEIRARERRAESEFPGSGEDVPPGGP